VAPRAPPPRNGFDAVDARQRASYLRHASPVPPAKSSRSAGPKSRLDDDWPDVLAALRRGLKDPDSAKASRTAVAYVQLVYGRQLQQKEDEQPTGSDPLDIASMTREQRDKLKRTLIVQHPHLVDELGLDPG
jgi:hypothetical protein